MVKPGQAVGETRGSISRFVSNGPVTPIMIMEIEVWNESNRTISRRRRQCAGHHLSVHTTPLVLVKHSRGTRWRTSNGARL
jgi:hypothetical protein